LKNLLSQLTVLYAEDEILVQRHYKAHFEEYFKAVYCTTDGQTALELYHEKRTDVAILDINMPLINGMELAKLIKEINKDAIIVMLTAIVDKTTLINAVEIDLCCYLEKPVTRKKMKQALEKIQKAAEKEHELELWNINNQLYLWNHHEKELYCQDNKIILTKNEATLLELFIFSEKRQISYQNIFNRVWPYQSNDTYNEATIKTLIKSLRAKLPKNVINNSYGIGYYLAR